VREVPDRNETTGHWFEPVADHLGPAYLRYSFTKGTANEVEFVMGALGRPKAASVLDVGCGPGRHALELARRGITVTGVDISQRFVDLARGQAQAEDLNADFVVGDARSLAFDATFDAAISLCQGGFGLTGGPLGSAQDRGGPTADRVELDEPVLAGMARAVRPGGLVIVSAFSAYFQLQDLSPTDHFDADLGVNRETTSVRNDRGDELEVDLWTTCYTPRELRLLARTVGLEVEAVHGVTPGDYRSTSPTIDRPEFLLVARRPMSDEADAA
jgi:SAM-dependent methyltransferase